MSDQSEYSDVVPTEDDAPVTNPAEFDEFNDDADEFNDDNVGGNNPDDESAIEGNPERTETFEDPDNAGHPGTT